MVAQMATIHVVYATSEGQTAKIASRLVDRLTEKGHDVQVSNVSSLPANYTLSDADAVLVGGSIHYGRQQRAIRRFARTYRTELSSKPTGFFQVCLAAVGTDAAAEAEVAGYVNRFVTATDWHPDRIVSFAGALAYSKYGFLKRIIMKRIASRTTGDTDSSRDYEYTDWVEVEQFATDFGAFVDARIVDTSSVTDGDAALP